MIKVGDIGTIFRITLSDSNGIVDISGATVMEIHFKKGDNTTIVRTASHTTDGTDGKLEYASIAGDLSISGNWKMEGFITLPSGSWTSDCLEFAVADKCAG